MISKRTFFRSVVGAVAAIAIAPEIAFGGRIKKLLSSDNQWRAASWQKSYMESFFWGRRYARIMENNECFRKFGDEAYRSKA